jgi:uncharacterized repeat protein (TIGR01451 family)
MAMRLGKTAVGVALVMLLGVSALGGAAATGEASTTQQVVATLTCQPATVTPGSTVGCTLTVKNTGLNNVNQVVVTDNAPGGTFLTSSSSLCTGASTSPGAGTATLSCNIGKLAASGTAGSIFTETHELQVPSSGTSLVQTVEGRFSPKPNSRASDTISTVTLTTSLDSSADFDGRFANANGESVHTGGGISATNPYTTGATVLGTAFATGLTVREQSAGNNNQNCPNGCFGGQVIQFDITPLDGVTYPASFTLTTQVFGGVIPPGTKAADVVVTHDGATVPDCTADTDPDLSCIVVKTIAPSTKTLMLEVKGPGDGNGGWGVG